MKVALEPGSIKRLVSVWRDSKPLPGERAPTRIAVDQFSETFHQSIVASGALVNTPRLQQFLIEDSPAGDRLLATLKSGPIKLAPRGDSWFIDLDRIERA